VHHLSRPRIRPEPAPQRVDAALAELLTDRKWRDRTTIFRPSILVSLTLCLIYTFATGRRVLAQETVGSVTELEGTAELFRAKQEFNVAIKMAVIARDKLQTMAKSSLTVTLLGGSQLRLAELSTMMIDDAAADARSNTSISLMLGHLRAVVRTAVGTPPNFEVHTPNAIVGVRGTEFETAYIEGKPCPGFPACFHYTEVGVYKGVVEVRNPTNPKAPPVRVTEGYETTVPCDLAPSSAAPLGMSELGAPGYR
jgi:hypothetical protein